MCGSSKADKAAERQRIEEEKRKERVKAEIAKINAQFSGFDDQYYDGVSKAYVDYYMPEFEEQFDTARRATIYATPGGAYGSAYNRAFETLARDRSREEVALNQRSQGFANQQRTNVEQNRGTLVQQAELAGGTGSAAERAVALSSALAAPPSYDPLGDLFARYTSTLASAQAARNAGFDVPSSPLLFNSRPKNSVSVIS